MATMRGELVLDLRVRALDLDDQHRLDIERVAGLGEGLADLDGRAVHVFQRHRDDAGADDRGDARARHRSRIETDQGRARALRLAQDAHRRLGDDAELALGAGDQAEQVIARRIEMRAAELDDGAIDEDHGDTEQVVGGDPVFQAMRPAGIHGDVARDRAGELARRVGGVEETAHAPPRH